MCFLQLSFVLKKGLQHGPVPFARGGELLLLPRAEKQQTFRETVQRSRFCFGLALQQLQQAAAWCCLSAAAAFCLLCWE